MTQNDSPATTDVDAEISALLATLRATERRLEVLTTGSVETPASHEALHILLQRRAQQRLPHGEAMRQASILNALPNSVALLDAQGVILSVNEAWRRYAGHRGLQGALAEVGANYLSLCHEASGWDAEEALRVAAGVQRVLAGQQEKYMMDYQCTSAAETRWFQMTVAPLRDEAYCGAVVIHADITELKLAEAKIAYLNRVYATLSGINSLVVRVSDRDELFREACRIAVEVGGFRMASVILVDAAQQMVPVASVGKDASLLQEIRQLLINPESAAKTMSAMAVSERRVVVANDSVNDPRVILGKRYAAAGVHSIALFPLLVDERVAGLFSLYASEKAFFKDEELALLQELAGDIAFAIDHIDRRARLNYLAYYDVLTGLANRALFVDRLRQFKRNARQHRSRLTLFLIDLERFKNLNDSLGRTAGDALLKQVADWLVQRLGDADLLARVGPDLFAAVLPVVTQEADARRSIESMLAAFPEHPFRLNEGVFRMAFKAGAAQFPDDGNDAETLFKNAEVALKKAKTSGEHYLFYTQQMAEAVAGKLSLENQLREAIDKGEFVLHYQPKIDLHSGKLTGAEALIRWQDPRSGLVAPGRFIPILEETGLIHVVGRWALRQALSDYLRWRRAGLDAVRIAVNVSPLQLRNRAFLAEIKQVLSVDADAAAGLELEITESVMMEDVRHNIANLYSVRQMGLRIAIDDFGTGFSSLAYLAKLPVDTLKIDRAFVEDMIAGPDGLALVSTIISLAHALKLNVVAEGVETDEQARLLRLRGCNEMQGYLCSRPLPATEFEERFLMRRY